ncbi:FAD-binding oxidoreductase [Fictibacillus phosphorivorans]|uniref:FAD-binding oxidoreductase n=1 Tax=Fictibacillus phosphorivorans TaxID=1221500 RepID=UPI002041BC4B|nr:FAD-linked oxidase C-terminal domain-containing protein [Fictibacillus phosphorivorans]MCM3717371.1 FAD-binding protein [Fictibacillus phosphorivorans]MCM3775066.1 FAD-binding protein [Fictibacillus phosphorivorans]
MKKRTSEKRATQNETILRQHSCDESYHTPVLPDVVVYPCSVEEISSIISFANEHKIPVVPFGAGSSLEGHCIPVRGGISLNFQEMNQILEIRPEDFLVKVQPGVTRTQLNLALKKYGLFFPLYPGADATIGGMAATNASGTTSVKYGIMRDQVRNLQVVLADGKIIQTGGLAAKSSAGYHLTSMFVGSEGTLGVFSEITLKVYGIPESVLAARCTFPSVQSAVEAASGVLGSGTGVARIELVDERSIVQVNQNSDTSYTEAPTLFLEFHGNPASVTYEASLTKELLESFGGVEWVEERDSKARAKLWEARHHLAYAFKHGYPGNSMMFTDVCLPLSELSGAIVHARETMDAIGVPGAVLGHVGDGNFHAILMYDPSQPSERVKADQVNASIVDYALNKGGTCTGEHGIGIGKAKYLAKEHADTLPIMSGIKKQLDPNGILNPDKIIL